MVDYKPMIRQPITNSRRYRSFIRDRDSALETFLRKSQIMISDILDSALLRSLEIISHRYHQIPEQLFLTNLAKNAVKGIELAIEHVFEDAAYQTLLVFNKLKRQSYLLSYTGEFEAISRATGKHFNIHISKGFLDQLPFKKSGSEEWITARISLAFQRLKRDIIDAVELSRVMESPITDALDRVKKTFPKTKRYVNPKRALTKLHEAKREEDETSLSDFFVDQNEWQELVSDYRTEYVPKRTGELLGEGEIYDWELEQQLTHEFVSDVLDPAKEAGKDSGVSEFVFVAVIDDKTDECCIWRDGLLISEIEARLEEMGDDCDDEVEPPLHINCRCRLVPFTEDLPEVETESLSSFDDWLNNV